MGINNDGENAASPKNYPNRLNQQTAVSSKIEIK